MYDVCDVLHASHGSADVINHVLCDYGEGNMGMIAQQMKIAPKNFRWYAAFHNEGHHPHVHMMAYSIDPNEAHLSTKGIETI